MEQKQRKIICALGFFDGVHVGHAALLTACRRLARQSGCEAAAVTFASHPDTLVLGSTPGLINTVRDRETLLRERFSMDRVVTLPFDETMKGLPWERFLEMLMKDYGAAGFVCGSDFRFGSRGAGTAEILADFCRDRGMACAVVPQQTIDGIRVSSTHIRRLLEAGDLASALRFLGHPHILSGTVVHGRRLGSRLGVPTANLRLPPELVAPKFGVYACKCRLEDGIYPAVTNLGVRPTVEGHHITVESWILDYQGDLYGKELTLEFYAFLRPERKFDSLEGLKEQILQDETQARRCLSDMAP